ncbi:MAG: DASS family sodium-coupled anion symporter [Bacteroidales bacterium]|nr:DASS family sodium-coupled anion symporter [Bacteroidales bacterium]
MRKASGLFLGILAFTVILIIPTPGGMSVEAKRAAACTILMAVWWITEALPISVTALLPLALYPLLKIMDAKSVVIPYANENIFLFMGGFFIAMAMQKHSLHRRIALVIIYHLGTSPRKLVLGFMVATAFLSMWISNTATTMMMLPIGLAVINHVKDVLGTKNDTKLKFGTALMLGIAYSASIGGVGTLVGTPPNIVFAGVIKTMFPGLHEIGFVEWMAIGLPIVIIFIPLTWLFLVYIASPPEVNKIPEGKEIISDEIKLLGKMSYGEKVTLTIFCLTALGWIFRKDIPLGAITIPGWSNLLGIDHMVHDSTVAIIGALLLFIIPVNLKKAEFILDWEWAKRIPWGILLLFGGGFALAESFQTTGLDISIGNIFSQINFSSGILIVFCICLFMTFLTEFTSNTATITMMLPVLGAMAVSFSTHPFLLMIPATIATSFAFMMPVATPPNAIIFGSNYIKIHQMARVGLTLNLIGVVIITLFMYLVAFPMLGIAAGIFH